jgi:hypothetical protein
MDKTKIIIIAVAVIAVIGFLATRGGTRDNTDQILKDFGTSRDELNKPVEPSKQTEVKIVGTIKEFKPMVMDYVYSKKSYLKASIEESLKKHPELGEEMAIRLIELNDKQICTRDCSFLYPYISSKAIRELGFVLDEIFRKRYGLITEMFKRPGLKEDIHKDGRIWCVARDEDTIDEMVQAGFDVNAPDENGRMPIQNASDKIDVRNAMKKHGATE